MAVDVEFPARKQSEEVGYNNAGSPDTMKDFFLPFRSLEHARKNEAQGNAL